MFLGKMPPNHAAISEQLDDLYRILPFNFNIDLAFRGRVDFGAHGMPVEGEVNRDPVPCRCDGASLSNGFKNGRGG